MCVLSLQAGPDQACITTVEVIPSKVVSPSKLYLVQKCSYSPSQEVLMSACASRPRSVLTLKALSDE